MRCYTNGRRVLEDVIVSSLDHSFFIHETPTTDQSNFASEQIPGVRRIRKELFVDNELAPNPHANPNPTFGSHRSLAVDAVANLLVESSQIDPMDVWRTYTRRSVDDKNGRAPLTCIWPVGHSEERITECGYGATPKLMRRHVQTTHMHIKRYRCDICDQAFSQGALLHSHKASKHAQIRPYKCPFEGCHKSYVDCPTLLRHKKINHNYIPKPITRYR
ncbi:hypothetical protein DFJ43DRAFT_363015 [Lentinula guzmanii]|uniref:C2H2-type domain-containing protein n=1 Tax=Lentinula guzmanii TaxID=2804957 RepID=A0AA38J9E4_9AGAR|nr:hypothetical protein DFJ43DRAFT_363015 [Lentinula guzmanii]